MKEQIQQQIKHLQNLLVLFERHEAWFKENQLEPDNCGGIDFNELKREQVTLVIQHFGGNWTKEYQGQMLNYVQFFDGVRVRIWDAELPPSCKLVKRTRHVVETIHPAHDEEFFEIECEKGETQDANS
jgi:hypothetical protein